MINTKQIKYLNIKTKSVADETLKLPPIIMSPGLHALTEPLPRPCDAHLTKADRGHFRD